MVSQPVKNYLHFMETENSLQYSEQSTNSSYSEPVESSPLPPVLFV